ncbi:MAG: hypothetical protein H7231_00995 [Rhodoferax sp.]|nr:hypothetical protein [Actinomycetota bacterium]
MFRYCARRCDDRAMAEDVLSVMFPEAWRARDRAVLVDETLRPWLLRIRATPVRRRMRRLSPWSGLGSGPAARARG